MGNQNSRIKNFRTRGLSNYRCEGISIREIIK